MRLHFLGAAQNVTGSRHLLDTGEKRILVDCGLYQERQFTDRNYDKFPIPLKTLDAVILTHAHLDHCGLLPKLVKDGFKGKIYCTDATAEIAKIILLDSAKLQTEDAEYKKKRHQKQNKKPKFSYAPLYTVEDSQDCFKHFQTVDYGQTFTLGDNVEVALHDAGHVLGSSIVEIKVTKGIERRTILFSGDIGRPGRPIVRDPEALEHADYVLIESTYGNRDHSETAEISGEIERIINDVYRKKGNLIIPSFALERSQEVLYYISQLQQQNKIPKMPVFFDSPMASKITTVFKHHAELFDRDTTDRIANHDSPFNLAGLRTTRKTEESKAIKDMTGPVIIIAGSGMCTGGRIKHHLVNNISDRKNTVMFVGYQAIGTLGRLLVDGKNPIRILGQMRKVKADIVRVRGFSAHADRNELLNWLQELKVSPRKIFVIHGEETSAKSFGQFLTKKAGYNVTVPKYNDIIELD